MKVQQILLSNLFFFKVQCFTNDRNTLTQKLQEN